MDWNRNQSQNRALWNQSVIPESLLILTNILHLITMYIQGDTKEQEQIFAYDSLFIRNNITIPSQ